MYYNIRLTDIIIRIELLHRLLTQPWNRSKVERDGVHWSLDLWNSNQLVWRIQERGYV